MITDIFSRRYAEVPLAKGYFEEDRRFMAQAAVMIMNPLWIGGDGDVVHQRTELGLKNIHDQLALELGLDYLSDRFWFQTYEWQGATQRQINTNSYATVCKNFLVKRPPEAKADEWIKDRLSLVELAFRLRWQQIQDANRSLPLLIAKAEADERARPAHGVRVPGSRANGLRTENANANERFAALSSELNERMRLARMPLTYHNGIIQLASDDVSERQVYQPFWSLVGDPIWMNVDAQMKEAVDRRDRGDHTAAFQAVCALESVIKIISDTKGWTRGSEKGASQYIDNLVSKANGQFIQGWESELLRAMFSDVRNPFAHGPGQSPMPRLSGEQTDWAIDTSMAWIKNLIRRL